MPDELLHKVCKALIGNPFLPHEDFASYRKHLESLNAPREIARLLSAGNLDLAKTLILAAGHNAACQSDSATKVLGPDVWTGEVTQLPRRRGDYLRVVMAAGRCFRHLAGVRGTSTAMQSARAETWAACFGDSLRHALELERVIRDHDMLILGETGTGKERFALAMQAATIGDDQGNPAPASAINAAAIPETLVESELFGHVKGAFTGATDPRAGRLRSADGGSFFLDEVGDLPSTTQVKLLRVIETNEVFPVGSDTSHSVDVRYIAATHKDLVGMAERTEFRRDLYERLAGNVLVVPPLRDRPEDIVEIGMFFVRSYLTATLGTVVPVAAAVTGEIERWLGSAPAHDYGWPGNVRELQNVLRNLLLGLPPNVESRKGGQKQPAQTSGRSQVPPSILDGNADLEEVSNWYMRRVVAKHEGNLTRAATALGVNRSTIRRKLG